MTIIQMKKQGIKLQKTLKLYGVNVPAEKYNTLKRLADIFANETYQYVPLKNARREAVLIALQAVIHMKEFKVKEKSR